MDRGQFKNVLKTVEDAFKPYAEIQKDRIFEYCQHLTSEQFRTICVSFIDNDKRPGVLDFRLRAQFVRTETYVDPITKDCESCCNTGMFEIFSLHGEFEGTIFIRCKCEHGKNSTWDKLPQWERGMEGLYKPKRIDAKEWKPVGGKTIEALVDLWRKKVRASLRYFDFSETIEPNEPTEVFNQNSTALPPRLAKQGAPRKSF